MFLKAFLCSFRGITISSKVSTFIDDYLLLKPHISDGGLFVVLFLIDLNL